METALEPPHDPIIDGLSAGGTAAGLAAALLHELMTVEEALHASATQIDTLGSEVRTWHLRKCNDEHIGCVFLFTQLLSPALVLVVAMPF